MNNTTNELKKDLEITFWCMTHTDAILKYLIAEDKKKLKNK